MSDKLYLAFIWHMHQPYYKNKLTGEISLPWVRLHGIKDYYDMAAMLEKFPNIRQNFNIVPSLIEQIEDYLQHPEDIKDTFLKYTRKEASHLTFEDKNFIISNFFFANWDNMIKVYPRYGELLEKRGRIITDDDLTAVNNFSVQEMLDLQVWFNLAWFDPLFKENDSLLKKLIEKGRNFSEEDKKAVIKKQFEVMGKIIPECRRLQDKGQIEVSVSPYYHPILPLLCDSNIAKIALPELSLPERFTYPEDARWHVRKAYDLYLKHFKRAPRGMWPSEGSVSEEAVAIIAECGFKWAASDEGVLFRSLGKERAGELLYQPYRIEVKGKKIDMVFRDHNLSDMIGFVYSKVDPEEAADDFLKHLRGIREYLKDKDGGFLVSVILDGENAWEFYNRDGWDFLTALYSRIEKEPGISTTTVSDYLDGRRQLPVLKNLFPASWINTNFSIWIGHREKNAAWNYLKKTREILADFKPSNEKEKENLKSAWEEIYIAEGSDWNWWYGDDNSSDNDAEFDRIFRVHLSNVYELIGREIPAELLNPIKNREPVLQQQPVGIMHPVIDGLDTDYYEWMNAGFYDVNKHGGTMHKSDSIVRRVYFGFDRVKFYLRFDFTREKKELKKYLLEINFLQQEMKAEVLNLKQAWLLRKNKKGQWRRFKKINDVSYAKVLEIGADLEDLGIKEKNIINILIKVYFRGKIIEKIPADAPINVIFALKNLDLDNWMV